jgi:hypothetical protein
MHKHIVSVTRLFLGAAILAGAIVGCDAHRDPVEIVAKSCWKSLLGQNARFGPMTMTSDGKKLAVSFFRHETDKTAERRLIVIDLNTGAHQTIWLDQISPVVAGSVDRIKWVDGDTTIEYSTETTLVRLRLADLGAEMMMDCLSCQRFDRSRDGAKAELFPNAGVLRLVVNGDTSTLLPASLTDVFAPKYVSWSPNGQYLAVQLDRRKPVSDDNFDRLAVITFSGPSVTVGDFWKWHPAGYPHWIDDTSVAETRNDPRAIVRRRAQDGESQTVVIVDQVPGLAVELGLRPIFEGQVSIDGKQAIFRADELGAGQIYVVDLSCVKSSRAENKVRPLANDNMAQAEQLRSR